MCRQIAPRATEDQQFRIDDFERMPQYISRCLAAPAPAARRKHGEMAVVMARRERHQQSRTEVADKRDDARIALKQMRKIDRPLRGRADSMRKDRRVIDDLVQSRRVVVALNQTDEGAFLPLSAEGMPDAPVTQFAAAGSHRPRAN